MAPGAPVVRVYHRCAAAATGSVLGPGPLVWYWWDRPGTGLRLVGPPDASLEAERAVRAAIYASLDASAAEMRRRQQDADAEDGF